MSEENKNDVVTGASETIDASSGSSMLEHEESKKEEATSPWPGPKGMIPVTSGKADGCLDAYLYINSLQQQKDALAGTMERLRRRPARRLRHPGADRRLPGELHGAVSQKNAEISRRNRMLRDSWWLQPGVSAILNPSRHARCVAKIRVISSLPAIPCRLRPTSFFRAASQNSFGA